MKFISQSIITGPCLGGDGVVAQIHMHAPEPVEQAGGGLGDLRVLVLHAVDQDAHLRRQRVQVDFRHEDTYLHRRKT
jgi:hypothetical protein